MNKNDVCQFVNFLFIFWIASSSIVASILYSAMNKIVLFLFIFWILSSLIHVFFVSWQFDQPTHKPYMVLMMVHWPLWTLFIRPPWWSTDFHFHLCFRVLLCTFVLIFCLPYVLFSTPSTDLWLIVVLRGEPVFCYISVHFHAQFLLHPSHAIVDFSEHSMFFEPQPQPTHHKQQQEASTKRMR